jgi:RimJ/RimL family protein N-acetyltransferase
MLVISGRRAALRDWRHEDLDVYGYWLLPHHAWHKFDGPYYAKPTPDKVPEMVDFVRQKIEANTWPSPRQRMVIARRDTDTLIGMVNWSWVSAETFWPEIGIAIFDDTFWRQGIGYEALGLWSDYLFQQKPELARLDLRTWSGNHGMMRLAQKIGYQEEARFRKARIVNGDYYDGLGYGVLREEWEARYPGGFAASLSSEEAP